MPWSRDRPAQGKGMRLGRQRLIAEIRAQFVRAAASRAEDGAKRRLDERRRPAGLIGLGRRRRGTNFNVRQPIRPDEMAGRRRFDDTRDLPLSEEAADQAVAVVAGSAKARLTGRR